MHLYQDIGDIVKVQCAWATRFLQHHDVTAVLRK